MSARNSVSQGWRARGRGTTSNPARGGGQGVATHRGAFRGDSRPPRGRGHVGDSQAQSESASHGRGHASGFSRGRGRDQPSGALIFAADTHPQIDHRLSDLDQLTATFKQLEITRELPLRPGYGTLGKEVVLRSNFFPVEMQKRTIYDYDVSITPTNGVKGKKSRIFYLLERIPSFVQHVNHIAHDGSERMVSAQELPQPLSIEVPFYEDGESGPANDATVYTVSITFARQLDTSDLTNYLEGQVHSRNANLSPLISALNIVLQSHASKTGVRVGKNRYFFKQLAKKMLLGPGIEARKGFFASVRPAYKQLMVNVNVCMTPFYVPGNLADAIMSFQKSSMGAMPRRFAQNVIVTTQHLKRKQRKSIYDICDKTAQQQTFHCSDYGEDMSVAQYFQKKYGIQLKHGHDLPVINVGTSKRPNYLPAELCEIEDGQRYSGHLGSRETANMIKHAVNPPGATAGTIVNRGLPTLGLSPGALQGLMDEFGLTISGEMAVIPARELPFPVVKYGSGVPKVNWGSWNILDVTFHRGATVKNWWLMVVRDPNMEGGGTNDIDPSVQQLCDRFAKKCSASGMDFTATKPVIFSTSPLPPPRKDPFRNNAIDIIRQTIKGKLIEAQTKPCFILVLLSGIDNHIYPGIKRIGDVELGVHTVCMITSKVFKDPKKQDQYLSNVALKLNTKLGGVNHLLDQKSTSWLAAKKTKTMLVGIDVTHPGRSSVLGTPSIAAMVASVDDDMVQFPASVKLQNSNKVKEMVTDLGEMLFERLLLYQKRNNRLPDRIIVYRDGVSEGQYQQVLNDELPQFLNTFKQFPKGDIVYQPTLTIIVCGKRHHARFFPTDSAHADKNGNTRAGTVVDKGVTDIFQHDFYLQAHQGLQGTVRPTHYIVIYDENELGADELQQGTHTLSYSYGRATKAVSLVPPAYYADLACERARFYLNDMLNASDNASMHLNSQEEREKGLKEARAKWGAGVHQDLAESMFYI